MELTEPSRRISLQLGVVRVLNWLRKINVDTQKCLLDKVFSFSKPPSLSSNFTTR
jgi:hypothetical protein